MGAEQECTHCIFLKGLKILKFSRIFTKSSKERSMLTAVSFLWTKIKDLNLRVLKNALFECTELATTAALDHFYFQNP